MENLKQALKRTTAVLMIAVLLIGIAPIGSLADVEWSEFVLRASAEEELAATGQCGENVYWNYDSSTGKLVISGTGPMYNYGFIYEQVQDGILGHCTAIFNDGYILDVEVDNGVTSIGDYAFYYCTDLTSITIPDSVTSIGDSAFSGCRSLTNIEIPNSVTSIGDLAFSDCRSLTNMKIPNSVTSIENSTFYFCYSLTSIKIPDGVTRIGDYAFEDCTGLTSIEIPDSVTSIGEMAFSGTEYYYDEDNWENGVLYIGNHLIDASEDISGNYIIKASTKTIADYAFAWREDLTDIEIPDSVTNIGKGAFNDCGSLTSITVAENNQHYLSDEYGVLFNKDKTTLIQYPVGNDRTEYTIPDGVIIIGDCAFEHCYNLTSIEVSDSVTRIGDRTFGYCNSLINIEIPDSVTQIGDEAFEWCESLISIEIPDGVTNLGICAFAGCNSLTNIEIPDSVTSIGRQVFAWCESLRSIEIPDRVINIDFIAFFDCENLTDVYYGGSENDWNKIIVSYYDRDIRDNTQVSMSDYVKEYGPITNATIHFDSVYPETPEHTHFHTSAITTPATCTTTGTKTYACSCGDSYTETIPATGHTTDNGTVTKPATCIAAGTKTYKCKACNAIVKTETIKATGHKETALKAVSPTYTSTGLTAGKKCSVCGTVTVAQKAVAKLTLGKVSGLKAKTVKVAKSSEITLSWNKIGDGVKYEVYQQNGKKWKKIKTTDKTSYTVKKLKADKEYQFRVRAVVDDVKGKYSSTLKVETIPATTTLKLKAGKKQLTASWSKVSDISGYEIQYSTSKKMKSAKKVIAKKSAKSTTIKKLTKGKKYYVRIRTYKTVNGKKIYSDWSKVKNVKVK